MTAEPKEVGEMRRIDTNTVMRPGLFLSVVLSIALLQLTPTFALQRDNFPTSSDYALKIPTKNGMTRYIDVPAATGGVYVAYDFKRINNWQRPPDQSADPSAFQLKCRRVGEAIEIDLSVVFGSLEQFLTMPVIRTLPTKGLRGQLIGSYSARLGETLSLQELARFGIEPISITVVSSKSRTLGPSEIGNETKAIQVVRADKARENYRLELKNISSKNIVALRVRGGEAGWSLAGPLIAPAQVYIMGFSDSVLRHPQDQGKIVVADVVFEDLTFEGEKEFAIKAAATKRGARIQWVRFVALLQAAIEGLKRDSQRALDNLRQQISALSEEAETRVVDELGRYFMPLTEKQLGSLIYELKDRLSREKRHMLAVIEPHEAEKASLGTNRESWLNYLKRGYEGELRKP
jgi:hypothetical protein